MKPLLKLSLVFAIACAGPLTADAQTMSLTLDEAIKLAVERNADLRISRLEMARAGYRVNEAIGTALPEVNGYGTYTRALKKPVFFLPDFNDPSSGRIIPIQIGSDHAFDVGLRATQILFNSAVFTGVGTAKIYQQASKELYRTTYNATIANVRKAFHGVLFARQVYEMTLASMKNAEENLKNVEAMNRQGIVSDYDFIRAQVQVDNIRPTVIQIEKNVLVAANGLKILLGLPAETNIQPIGEIVFEPVDDALLAQADTMAVHENAMLKALDLQTRVNDEIVTIRRSEYLPTLAAFGNYSFQGQSNQWKNIALDNFVQSAQVGLSLSVNLFNGFQSTARVDQAEVDYLKSVAQLEQTQEAIQTRVQSVKISLQEARRRVESQTKTVEQAEKGYRIATTRYSAGTGTQLEISDADIALLRARVNRAQAVYDYSIAKTDLEELLSVHRPDY